MNNSKDINKYAEGIFITAGKCGNLSEISAELTSLLNLYKTTPEIRLFLESRRVDRSSKAKILKSVLENTISNFSLSVLLQLLEDDMILVIEVIINRVQTLIDLKRDIVEVEVSTASSISDNECKLIMLEIEKKLKKKVKIINTIDPNILGGVKLRISNTIIDGSIATRLKKLGELLYQQ